MPRWCSQGWLFWCCFERPQELCLGINILHQSRNVISNLSSSNVFNHVAAWDLHSMGLLCMWAGQKICVWTSYIENYIYEYIYIALIIYTNVFPFLSFNINPPIHEHTLLAPTPMGVCLYMYTRGTIDSRKIPGPSESALKVPGPYENMLWWSEAASGRS